MYVLNITESAQCTACIMYCMCTYVLLTRLLKTYGWVHQQCTGAVASWSWSRCCLHTSPPSQPSVWTENSLKIKKSSNIGIVNYNIILITTIKHSSLVYKNPIKVVSQKVKT